MVSIEVSNPQLSDFKEDKMVGEARRAKSRSGRRKIKPRLHAAVTEGEIPSGFPKKTCVDQNKLTWTAFSAFST